MNNKDSFTRDNRQDFPPVIILSPSIDNRVTTNLENMENLENSGNLKDCQNLRENSGEFELL